MAYKKKSSKLEDSKEATEAVVEQAAVSVEHNHEALEASIASLEAKVVALQSEVAELKASCEAKVCKAEAGGSSAGSIEEIYAYVWSRLRSRNARP